ncbi:hypothetical protein [Clostridium sp. Maddingley MBC34-26]|nr:hypothetical protein [Clostridium sp. Maddingley MBC34-26]
MKFVEFMIEKKSLRFCAENLSINLVTAFYWRHKVLHALTLDDTPNMLKGIIYIGKTIVKENFKGCRNIEEIRQSTHRRRNIWIIGAKGEEDSMFIKPIFKDFWDLKLFNEKVYTKIEKKSYIVSYGDRYLSLVAQKHNKKRLINVKDDNRIRYMILNLMNWFAVFRGVATKYLQRYLSFYILFNLDRIFSCMELIYNDLLSGNRFIRTNQIRIVENYMY